MNVVDGEPLILHKAVKVKAEGAAVDHKVLGPLVEGHQNERLAILKNAVNEKRDRQHGFAATRTAADQGRAPARQSAAGQLVEAGDAARNFSQNADNWARDLSNQYIGTAWT